MKRASRARAPARGELLTANGETLPTLPTVPSKAPALEVEHLLEWAGRRQKVWELARRHRMTGEKGIALNAFGPKEMAFAQDWPVHRDAVCVMLAVRSLADLPAQRLVVLCAEQGERPNWGEGLRLVGRWVAVQGPAGAASAVANEFGRHRLGYVSWAQQVGGPFTAVEWIDAAEEQRRWRAAYARWREALDVVYAMLLDLHEIGVLEREPMPATAPRRPWVRRAV